MTDRATPEPSAAAQPSGPCLHVPGIGEPECSCTHCRSYGGHPCPYCRQLKPDLADQMRQAWLADNPGLVEALDRHTQPAAPQAEGEGASGAGVDDWRSTTISSEIASLRADRDRLERSSNAWQDRAEALEEQQRELIPTVQRLERELEEARRERDELRSVCESNADAIAFNDDLMGENRRLRDALEEIVRGAPDEEPEYDDWGGDTEDAERWGLEQGAWLAGQIARRALHAPTTEDGAPESVGTHPDGTTGPDMCESER